MALKTLDPKQKQAIEGCGCSLTPTMEHLAALTAIDWQKLIAELGQAAQTLIPIILSLIGVLNPPPNPTPVTRAASGDCCDHAACCRDTLKAILKSAEICARHCCDCCNGCY